MDRQGMEKDREIDKWGQDADCPTYDQKEKRKL